MSGKIGLQDTEFDPDIHNAVDFDFFDEDDEPTLQTVKTTAEIHHVDSEVQSQDSSEIVINTATEKVVLIQDIPSVIVKPFVLSQESSVKPVEVGLVQNQDSENRDSPSVLKPRYSIDSHSSPSVSNSCFSVDNHSSPSVSKHLFSIDSPNSPSVSKSQYSHENCDSTSEDTTEIDNPDSLQETFSLLTVNPGVQAELQCGNDDNSDDSLSDSEHYSDSSFECDDQCNTVSKSKVNGAFSCVAKNTKDTTIRKDSLDETNADVLDRTKTSPQPHSVKSKEGSKFKQIAKLRQWTPTPSTSRTRINSARSLSGQRRKNMTFSNDEVRRIDRENMILLRRIFEQQRLRDKPKSATPKMKSAGPKTVQQRKIDQENALLLRKIQNAKPSKDVASAFGACSRN